jgi:hypothetical protein
MKKKNSSAPSRPVSTLPVAASIPSHTEITERAAEIWRNRGCPESCDEEIWLEAERQLGGHSVLGGYKGEPTSTLPLSRLNLNTDEVMSELEELFPEASGKETTSL